MEVLNSTPTLTCSLFGGNLEIFSSLNSKKVGKEMKKMMVKMESLFTSTCQFSKSSLNEEKLEERRRRERKRRREIGWDEGMNSNEFILIL